MLTSDAVSVAELHKEAQRLVSRGDLGAAQQCCLRILQVDKNHADAHFLLGIIAAGAHRYANAVEFIERAIELAGDRAEYLAHLGRCLAMLRQESAAENAATKALAMEPGDALTWDTIGVVFSRIGNHTKAVDAFHEAVLREPRNPSFQFNLGSSLKFLGDFTAAEAAYEAAIDTSPRFYKAHSSLAQLRRQTPQRNHIDRLKDLLSNVGDNVNGELHLRHALAKEYEDLEQYDLAFKHLAAGNARKRKEIEYSSENEKRLFDTITGLFSVDTLNQPSVGFDTEEPIFVVGMPRTGTTLVERILGSHPMVTAAGELQNLPLAVKTATNTRSSQVLDVDTLEAAMRIDFTALGRAYVESTRPVTGCKPRFVDKMPLNFLYVGFIHLALPKAKIVCLRRNPLDTCLSNFRQLFAVKFSYYNYAYDLLDTGRYYIQFHRLLEHWNELLPGKILEVQYERLVNDQESQTRQLLEYCELPWDNACLAFERNVAPVATASSVQVREPIYDAAVARWRLYEKHLQPVRELLEAEGISVE